MSTMTGDTVSQYDDVVKSCKEIFQKKTKDYGSSWRVYRCISVADQIYIKAQRIKNIQELQTQKVEDSVDGEFMGILNYAVIGLIQLELAEDKTEDIAWQLLEPMYDAKIKTAKALMLNKNHDYGEAWREMSQESFVDLTLAKILRIKQIIQNKGKAIISEGIDANFYDILNYAVFALILIEEKNKK